MLTVHVAVTLDEEETIWQIYCIYVIVCYWSHC